MEIVVFLVLAVAILAVGVRVGMLLAPRVERMADRANPADRADRSPPEPATVGQALAETAFEHESTDEGDDVRTR